MRILLICLSLLLTACAPNRHCFEPNVVYTPVEREFECTPSAFPPLSESELGEAWGAELKAGRCFAKELDFYRAITCFKKALFLIPEYKKNRVFEIEHNIIQSYFIAGHYADATNAYSNSTLQRATSAFPAFSDLLIILWESFRNLGDCEKADLILQMIEKNDPELANSLKIYTSLTAGDLGTANILAENTPKEGAVDALTQSFYLQAKSPRTAEILNAALPGAGYWYVGEKRAAVTSFVINALFIWATYNFFERGYPAAGLITLSLETGWYFGGINGAALEAKYYNERLYNQNAESIMSDCRLFPAIMLDFSF